MASDYLKLRGHTWYVQMAVPKARQNIVGKRVLVQSLGTRDRAEANRRKHAVLADLQRLILGHTPPRPTRPSRTAPEILALALEQRAAIEGGADPAQSEAGFDVVVDDFLDARAAEVGRDNEGNPLLPADELALVHRSYRALTGRLELTLERRIVAYLEEQQGRLTAQTLGEKRRRLSAFAAWFGVDREASEVARGDAGRYLSEVIQRRSVRGPDGCSAPSSSTTKKKEVSDLRAFFEWLLVRGFVASNPFDRMSSTVKGSTRGKASARRPWSPAELSLVLRGVSPNDPLWSLTVIAAYTGMRREEVAELRAEDVEGDILLIRQGKTAAAVRRVPVSPVLAPLVARLSATSSDGFLIPGLLRGGPDAKRAWYVGKRFGLAIRALGIADSSLDFHALRATVITKLEEAGVPLPTMQLIVGHTRSGVTLGVYSGGVSDDVKRKAMRTLSYGKDLDAFVRKTSAKVTVAASASARKRSR